MATLLYRAPPVSRPGWATTCVRLPLLAARASRVRAFAAHGGADRMELRTVRAAGLGRLWWCVGIAVWLLHLGRLSHAPTRELPCHGRPWSC